MHELHPARPRAHRSVRNAAPRAARGGAWLALTAIQPRAAQPTGQSVHALARHLRAFPHPALAPAPALSLGRARLVVRAGPEVSDRGASVSTKRLHVLRRPA